MPVGSENDPAELYPEAVGLCAADARGGAGAVRVRSQQAHYKSRVLFLDAGETDPAPRWVLKVETGDAPTQVGRATGTDWDPEREFAGLAFVADRLGNATDRVCIEPLGCGSAPRWLLTRYQKLESLRPVFDRAVRRGRVDALRDAERYAGLIARWLARFREAETRAGEGESPVDYASFTDSRLREIEALLGARDLERRLSPLLKQLLGALAPTDVARLRDAYPVHGDLAPQNFGVDPKGRLSALDLEGFRFAPGNLDLFGFRSRLEDYALWGGGSRARAQTVWHSFWSAWCAAGESAPFALLCYLRAVLAHLAWIRNPTYLAARRPWSTRVRERLWARQRLRWLADLSGDLVRDAARLGEAL